MALRKITHLLDTHVWVWTVNRDPLPARVLAAIADPNNRLAIAAISIWEVAKLVEKGRILLAGGLPDWFSRALPPSLHVEPITAAVAAQSTNLPGFHQDPADEMIVATGLILNAVLITSDRRIRHWRGIQTLWN